MSDARDELVDIVDENDNVVATVTRREMRANHLRHRAVYIAVIDGDGRLLVHQRSFAKDIAPGWWDVAVGGVVGAGEGYDAAAIREVAEEIGIVARLGSGAIVAASASQRVPVLEELGRVSFEDQAVRIRGRAYRLDHDGPFTFADGEVIAAEWIAPADLPALIEERDVCDDSLEVLFPFLGFSRTRDR